MNIIYKSFEVSCQHTSQSLHLAILYVFPNLGIRENLFIFPNATDALWYSEAKIKPMDEICDT